MSDDKSIIELLKNNSSDFTEEELKKIIDTELEKSEKDRNEELMFLCINALNHTDSPSEEKKKKFPIKPLLFIIAAILLLLLNAGFLPGLRSLFSGKAASETHAVTTSSQTVATTENTTSEAEVITKGLNKPSKIIFLQNGEEQLLTDKICSEITEDINETIKERSWNTLKLAVTKDYIDKIKKENLCIEICFDGVQQLSGLKGESVNKQTYCFEKILVVLDGDNKNTLFFEKDGKYQNGPIIPVHSDMAEEILREISDKN